MKHLDDGRLGDAIDGRIARADAEHLEACADCRTQLAALSAVLQQVTDVEAPAPSPLFWEHFRGRVARAIDEPEPARALWTMGAPFRWLTSAAALLTVALVAITLLIDPRIPSDPGVAVPASAVAAADADNVDQDEAWALVRSLAEDLDYESAHDAGVAPAPGAVERAAVELTPSEQTALVELLEQAMKRTDS